MSAPPLQWLQNTYTEMSHYICLDEKKITVGIIIMMLIYLKCLGALLSANVKV